jgi:opacity protein-like surface antigen
VLTNLVTAKGVNILTTRGIPMHKKISFKKMRTHVIRPVTAGVLLVSLAGLGSAQEEEHKWTANLGAGFTPLVGALDKRLDNGWNITFGGGYRFTEHFSLGGQVMYNGLGVSKGVLSELAVPNGNARVWVITAEPRFEFAPRSKVTPYIVGGVGYYRRVVEFTRPTVAAAIVFDPFFFDFFPVLIPANVVIGRVIRDGIGGNAGIGFQVPVGRGVKIFTEARYHYSNGGGIPTRMIPLTIGVRF